MSALAERMEARFATAQEVADALMYEGYILYPYATHGKNQGGVRFQWGVLVPPAWTEIDPSERTATRTELIVDPGDEPVIAIRLRFLQLQRRTLEVADAGAAGGFRPIARLVVGEQVWTEWDEAIEHQVDLGVIPLLPLLSLLPLADAAPTVSIDLPASQETEVVAGAPADPAPAGPAPA
ncbi:MAG: hypothetical protein M3083_19075, partial [Actinomycetota bacterium]|nr:hypothetical protein [Actinomycetota bacterium]